MKVVADSNIYISGLLYPGKPATLLEMAVERRVELFISQDILDEIIHVLSRPRFRRTAAQVAEARQLMEEITTRIEPTVTLDVVKDDPDDNKILECAVASGADVVISGDNHLLKLKEHGGMPIMKIADFLRTHSGSVR